MDYTSITVALISGITAGLATVSASKRQHDVQMAVIYEKLDSLTKSVNKHNSVIERTFVLEGKISSIEDELNRRKNE